MSLEPSSNRYQETWHIYFDTKPENTNTFHGKEITVIVENAQDDDKQKTQSAVKNALENLAENIISKKEMNLDIEQITLKLHQDGTYSASLKLS
jgi:Zn-dependent M16 (insulinase) family peptidase